MSEYRYEATGNLTLPVIRELIRLVEDTPGASLSNAVVAVRASLVTGRMRKLVIKSPGWQWRWRLSVPPPDAVKFEKDQCRVVTWIQEVPGG